jgi:hypothetical protein
LQKGVGHEGKEDEAEDEDGADDAWAGVLFQDYPGVYARGEEWPLSLVLG